MLTKALIVCILSADPNSTKSKSRLNSWGSSGRQRSQQMQFRLLHYALTYCLLMYLGSRSALLCSYILFRMNSTGEDMMFFSKTNQALLSKQSASLTVWRMHMPTFVWAEGCRQYYPHHGFWRRNFSLAVGESISVIASFICIFGLKHSMLTRILKQHEGVLAFFDTEKICARHVQLFCSRSFSQSNLEVAAFAASHASSDFHSHSL